MVEEDGYSLLTMQLICRVELLNEDALLRAQTLRHRPHQSVHETKNIAFCESLIFTFCSLYSQGWAMDEEAPPAGRDAKFSWEVIRDNSVFTYRIYLVPAYAEIMAAIQASVAHHHRRHR